jgi:hypothetical protein
MQGDNSVSGGVLCCVSKILCRREEFPCGFAGVPGRSSAGNGLKPLQQLHNAAFESSDCVAIPKKNRCKIPCGQGITPACPR